MEPRYISPSLAYSWVLFRNFLSFADDRKGTTDDELLHLSSRLTIGSMFPAKRDFGFIPEFSIEAEENAVGSGRDGSLFGLVGLPRYVIPKSVGWARRERCVGDDELRPSCGCSLARNLATPHSR